MSKSIIMIKMHASKILDKIGDVKVSYPCYETDKEKYDKLKDNYEMTAKCPRNLKHHRKIFALFNTFIDNIELDRAFDIDYLVLRNLEIKLKSQTDIVCYIFKWMFLPLEQVILPNGKIVEVVSSISFANMDQLEFNEFYNKCIDYIADRLGITKNELEQNTGV